MTTEPTTPKGRRTWQGILESARKIFARDGFVAARMSDVADEAGISMGGLYRYFANKEDLFEQLISDLHEELYQASRSDHRFADEPLLALREANQGYLQHYYDNRDIMRAFIEAAAVEERFRSIWWNMRNRHADRFSAALREHFDISEVEGVDVAVASDAMACMAEQCAYVWFGHDELHDTPVQVDEAAAVVTRAWYRMFFDDAAEG